MTRALHVPPPDREVKDGIYLTEWQFFSREERVEQVYSEVN